MLFFVLLFCNAIGGLMRDIFTHKITTPEHWQMLMMPTVYTRAELDYDVVVGNDTVVTPSYDPHCDPAASQITGGCEPVAVISAENLRNGNIGKQETALIGQVLQSDQRMGQYVIAQDGKLFVHPCFLLLWLKGFTICLTPTFVLTLHFYSLGLYLGWAHSKWQGPQGKHNILAPSWLFRQHYNILRHLLIFATHLLW